MIRLIEAITGLDWPNGLAALVLIAAVAVIGWAVLVTFPGLS